jgi:hypothetical protein
MFRKIAPAVLVAFAASSAVFATVTFDPATGAGFVGKGDVQLAFGWNNATLQRSLSGIGFNYVKSDVYEATCMWETGPTRNRRQHRVERTSTVDVTSTVAYDPRVRNQVTGFTLTGLGATSISGDALPEVGGSCIGEGTDGTWESVEQISSEGGLYVNHAGNSVRIQ